MDYKKNIVVGQLFLISKLTFPVKNEPLLTQYREKVNEKDSNLVSILTLITGY